MSHYSYNFLLILKLWKLELFSIVYSVLQYFSKSTWIHYGLGEIYIGDNDEFIQNETFYVPRAFRPQKWNPPSQDRYKVNIATSVHMAQRLAGMSVLIRAHTGFVMAAMCCTLPLAGDQFQIETRATSKALTSVLPSLECL